MRPMLAMGGPPRDTGTRRSGGWLAVVLVALLAGVLGLGPPAPTAADTRAHTTPTITRPGAYDYAPSVMLERDPATGDVVRRLWWCGTGTGWDGPTDTIWHAVWSDRHQTWTVPPRQVMAPEPGAWDQQFVCDPSVVRGSFRVDGHRFSYAMYYTGIATRQGVNRVGVAFSDDGIHWHRFSGNPVIGPADPGDGWYGAGQPSAVNLDGASRVRVFYTDTTVQPGLRIVARDAPDGVDFGEPPGARPGDGYALVVCEDGGAAPPWMANADFALDPRSGYWYAALPLGGRRGDRDSFAFVWARIHDTDLFERRGTHEDKLHRGAPLCARDAGWRQLGTEHSTNLNGHRVNTSPGLARDRHGHVLAPWRWEAYYGAGPNHELDWDLYRSDLEDAPSTAALVRYVSADGSDHLVTVGAPPGGYEPEGVVGFVLASGTPGTVMLRSCVTASGDHFASLDARCEGHVVLGGNGALHPTDPGLADTAPLLRCVTHAGDHFVSLDRGCEGHASEGVLGYVELLEGDPASTDGMRVGRRAADRAPAADPVTYGAAAWRSGRSRS